MTREMSERAVNLMDRGRWTEAAVLWQQVVALDGEDFVAHNKLGICEVELGDDEAARACFERALQIKPKMPQALSNLGNVELAAGDTSAAIEFYQKAIAADRDYAIAYKNLSIAYKKAGQVDRAVRALKKAHSLGMAGISSAGYDAPGDRQVKNESPLRSCLIWVLVLVLLLVIVMRLR